MDSHILTILLCSCLGILIFIIPPLLKDKVLTTPIVFVAIGYLTFLLPIDLPIIDPKNDLFDRKVLEYLTEFIVIVSLAGIGLKIDRKPNIRNWKLAIPLMCIVMPLTILGMIALGYQILGLGLSTGLLLGAVIAPTDPVLASNVQVRPPNEGDSHPVRFGLTVEAGLNDGLAFPFVFLALAIESGGTSLSIFSDWFWHDLLYKIVMAIIVGFLLGKILSKLFFRLVQGLLQSEKHIVDEGIFLISAAFLCYGITEWVGGYGFLAVFIAAVVSRQYNDSSKSLKKKYKAIDQIEQLVLLVFLFIFGGLLATIDFSGFNSNHILISLLAIFVIRPLAGVLGMLFTDHSWRDRGLISFLGIRGVGSIYYLAFAFNQNSDFSLIEDIWFITTSIIVFSLIVHGISARYLVPKS